MSNPNEDSLHAPNLTMRTRRIKPQQDRINTKFVFASQIVRKEGCFEIVVVVG